MSSNNQGVYIVRFSGVITVAKTLIQIAANASSAIELIYASITSASLDVSDTGTAEILRKSAAATVTSFTPLKTNPLSQAAKAVGGTALTGHTATVEGTDGDILWDEGFNVLNGFVWMPTPEMIITAPQGGFLALVTRTTITSQTLKAMMVFKEIG